MRKIVYEYSPVVETSLMPSSAVIHTLSTAWQSIRPEIPLAAAGEYKPVFQPSAYKASNSFVLRPNEWLVILFIGQDPHHHQSYRPGFIYDIKPAWPRLKLELNEKMLGILVQNTSNETHIFIHADSRLHHLLHMSMIDHCFTHVSQNDFLEVNNPTTDDNDVDVEEEEEEDVDVDEEEEEEDVDENKEEDDDDDDDGVRIIINPL